MMIEKIFYAICQFIWDWFFDWTYCDWFDIMYKMITFSAIVFHLIIYIVDIFISLLDWQAPGSIILLKKYYKLFLYFNYSNLRTYLKYMYTWTNTFIRMEPEKFVPDTFFYRDDEDGYILDDSIYPSMFIDVEYFCDWVFCFILDYIELIHDQACLLDDLGNFEYPWTKEDKKNKIDDY